VGVGEILTRIRRQVNLLLPSLVLFLKKGSFYLSRREVRGGSEKTGKRK
jgi:hypothetical protein